MHERPAFMILNLIFTALAVISCVLIFSTNSANHTILFASTYLAIISIIDAKLSKIPNKIGSIHQTKAAVKQRRRKWFAGVGCRPPG